MRINSANKRSWFVNYSGEQSVDDGGLFRDSITEMCNELRKPVLPLLVETKNQ